MTLNCILHRDCAKSAVPCTSKKRALEIISELAAPYLNQKAQPLFECMLSREKMGTTGIGNGIAIPHGRIQGVDHPIAILLQCENAIDFDAIDNKPVDLLFALFVPEDQCQSHLKTLSQIAEKFQNKAFCKQLRYAENDDELYRIMTGNVLR